MKKIISLFQRDRNGDSDNALTRCVTIGAEWVADFEGVATQKYDGTCCMIRDGQFFRRYDAKHGKTPPAGFEPAQDPDPITGHWPGWLPVGTGPENRWHWEAFDCSMRTDGTYELCGPKIQGNPEGFPRHLLIYHGADHLLDAPRDFDWLRYYLGTHNIEGIVWHHPDGRMVKIKGKDFGLKRPKPVLEGAK